MHIRGLLNIGNTEKLLVIKEKIFKFPNKEPIVLAAYRILFNRMINHSNVLYVYMDELGVTNTINLTVGHSFKQRRKSNYIEFPITLMKANDSAHIEIEGFKKNDIITMYFKQ